MKPFIPAGPPRFAHQARGLRKIIETRGRCALLFEPGLGKTATALDYASLLALKAPSGEARVLVVAPLAAVDTWVQQAPVFVHEDVRIWAEALRGSIRERASILAIRGQRPFTGARNAAPARKAGDVSRAVGWQKAVALEVRDPAALATSRPPDPAKGPNGMSAGPRLVIEVVNLDTFSSRSSATPGSSTTTADLMVEAVKRFAPDLMVVDESHRIKSASSNVSRTLARLTSSVPRRILLTGTVMPHSPMDVFGQWRFMAPEAFSRRQGRPATYTNFKARYAKLGGYMGKQITGFENLDEMQDIMARNSVVARKADALDLPPTTEVVVPVDLSPREVSAYKSMKETFAAQFSDGTDTTAGSTLTRLMRLRQITSGFLHDTDSGATENIGDSKLRTIASLVQDTLAGEKRIVVFCVFRHEIDRLAATLGKERGTRVDVITGATKDADRIRIRQHFGSQDPQRTVLIAQTRTMSLAVNELVTASHAIYGSLSQQRDDQIQSQDRLNRLGQTKPVTFWLALAPGTVDQVIHQAHRDRSDLERAMLAHLRE